MTRWIDLYIQKASYISKEFDVQSSFETYFENFIYTFEKNDGTVDIFVRLSFDGTEWSEWIKISDSMHVSLFNDEFYNLEHCKFQYKVEMVNNGSVSPQFSSFTFELSGGYILSNRGDMVCKPELWIKKINTSGTIKLTNETNGQILELKDLNKDETVYVDCENEDIVTDLPLKYRYNDHNNVFLDIEVGENILTGEGEFELVIRYQFKSLQG